MKILKYGEGYPKTVTCDTCKSELEYNLADIETYKDVQFVSDPFIKYNIVETYNIKCPVCGHKVYAGERVIESVPRDNSDIWWKKYEELRRIY